MKKFGYVLAALGAIVIAAPSIASAETVVIKRDGYHHGYGARAEFREHHARRTIGARPYHRGIRRDITGLNAAGNRGTIRRAAQIGFGETVETTNRECGGGANQQMTPGQSSLRAHRDCH